MDDQADAAAGGRRRRAGGRWPGTQPLETPNERIPLIERAHQATQRHADLPAITCGMAREGWQLLMWDVKMRRGADSRRAKPWRVFQGHNLRSHLLESSVRSTNLLRRAVRQAVGEDRVARQPRRDRAAQPRIQGRMSRDQSSLPRSAAPGRGSSKPGGRLTTSSACWATRRCSRPAPTSTRRFRDATRRCGPSSDPARRASPLQVSRLADTGLMASGPQAATTTHRFIEG